MTRRQWLQLACAAGTAPLLSAVEPSRPLFFTPQEYSLLDTLTELIVPADDHSPGAHQAGVAKFIDFVTAQSFPGEAKTSWTDGLRKVDAEAKQKHGSAFVNLSTPQQVALLQDMDQRNDPFFGQLKQTTAFAYYSSSIGIHQEMGYLGNVLLQEFVGYSVT